jgi:hypothetical protein
MKKLTCALLTLIPLICFSKSRDNIVNVDGQLHSVIPQNTVTFQIESKGEVRKVGCSLIVQKESDRGAQFKMTTNNYIPASGLPDEMSGFLTVTPLQIIFLGKTMTISSNYAFIHFVNLDITKTYEVACFNI